MIDTAFMATNPEPVSDNGANVPPAGPAEPLEQRVRRLEDAVAALQDTRGMEDRVVERLAERVTRTPAPPVRSTTGVLVEAGRKLLPAAVTMVQSSPADAAPPAAIPVAQGPNRWLVFDVYDEVRTIVRMCCDRRYHCWSVRLIPVVAGCMILFSWFFISGTLWPVGSLLDKVFDVGVVFVACAALSRKAAHYRAAFGQAPPPAGR